MCCGVIVTLLVNTPYTLIYIGPCLVGGILALPMFGGTWPGFSGWASAGKLAPLYSSVPIGYGETSWLILKANTVRILCASPFVVICGAALGWRMLSDMYSGILLATELTFLLLALQPVAILLKYSQVS